MLKIDKHQWRVFLLGRRVHHGAAGMFLVGFGLMLVAHDWADRAEWF